MRQRRANDLDRAHQVGVKLADDLLVCRLLGGPDEGIPGVVHDHIDMAEVLKRGIDHLANRGGVCHVQRCNSKLFSILGLEAVKLLELASCTRDAIATLQECFTRDQAETAVDSRDEPCPLCQGSNPSKVLSPSQCFPTLRANVLEQ